MSAKMKTFISILFIVLILSDTFIAFGIYSNYTKTPPKTDPDSIIMLLKSNNKNNSHPRLMMTSSDIKRIKTDINKDAFIKDHYNSLKKKADAMLDQVPVKYDIADGIRLLPISRTALDRIQTLCLMYNISTEEKYAKRAWLELQTICDANPDRKNYTFPDWHPAHFLDTAEMTNAAAIGYDWLYNYLNINERTIIREAIYRNGLVPTLNAYDKKEWWTTTDSNWNAVCNSGISLGALAIGDEGGNYEAAAGKILSNSINNLSTFVHGYSSNGGWFEGVNYWDYATTYCAYFLSSLDSALKTDYGVSNIENFSKAGDFLIYTIGPSGFFNFGDSSLAKIKPSVMLWLANKFNNGNYLWYYINLTFNTSTPSLSIIWYNKKVKPTEPKNSYMYFNVLEVATMHTSLLSNNDTFVGLKAGRNNLSHSDLDLGTFVYDALGERWISDLGSEDYNVPGYWDMGSSGKRWSYYKKRAEGHNTIVLSAGSGNKVAPDQNVYASTTIDSVTADNEKVEATANLTNAYTPTASSVIRKCTLYKSTSELVIEDTVSSANPTKVNLYFHTYADVLLSEDKKSLILTKNNKKIKMSIESPSGSTFNISSTTVSGEPPNSKNILSIINIEIAPTKDLKMQVTLSPVT